MRRKATRRDSYLPAVRPRRWQSRPIVVILSIIGLVAITGTVARAATLRSAASDNPDSSAISEEASTSDRAGDPSASSSPSAAATESPSPTASPSPSAAPAPPPAAPATASVAAVGDRGIVVEWAAPAGTAPSTYTVNRATDAVTFSPVSTLAADAARYLDINVTPGQRYSYRVSAVDAAGVNLGDSPVMSGVAATVSSGTGRRYASCPAASVSVSTSAALKSALASASPGTVIRLSPGTYPGGFIVPRSGSAGAPIWICGPRSAVLTTNSSASGHAVALDGRHDIVLAGFTIDTAFKGVTIVNSQRITVTDLLVQNIGYEAIHLRKQTVDSEVTFNTIRRIGVVKPEFGEGVYLGTSDSNWCEYNGCQPDRTMRIRVYGNTISDTGAQAIEAKAGSSDGVIAANTITSKSPSSTGDGWITIKGNGWLVADNVGHNSPSHGFATNASVDGWGRDNLFVRNSATNTAKYGTWIHKPNGSDTLGNRVSCLGTAVNTAGGAMNVACVG